MGIARLLGRLARDRRGGSAAEFAFIAPIMMSGLVGTIVMGNAVYDRMDMLGAVRAGVQYWMNGGRDMALVTQVVELNWSSKPGDGVVEPEQVHMCGETQVEPGTICGDGSTPMVFLSITATGTYNWAGFERTVTMNEVTRVR